ncbi:MAG: pilus assembly protein TadG-related protein [Acidobacteriota bacterium]
MVPVIFGLMGFAVDLGRLYLIRGELKTAANAMALAAAGQLIGTDAALEIATDTALLTLDQGTGAGNRYNFGMLQIGQTTGLLTSETPTPAYYSTVANATASDAEGGEEASGTTARHVRLRVTAEAPLLFWSFLSLGQERKTSVTAQAVAGRSAPLCTACGIEPLAIAALDLEDATDFGLIPATKYTLAYFCTGAPTPAPLSGTAQVVRYLILDHYNAEAETLADEATQLYRIGAQGLLPSTNQAISCLAVNAEKLVWSSAAPRACNQPVVSQVSAVLCGMASRFSTELPSSCASIPEVDAVSIAYAADSDLTDLDDYATYIGNARRIITVPVVESLSSASTMVVVGFRQFLVEPNPNDTNLNPADSNGRFAALYLGSVAPVRQGRFDGCQLAAGPGKVVLHQ